MPNSNAQCYAFNDANRSWTQLRCDHAPVENSGTSAERAPAASTGHTVSEDPPARARRGMRVQCSADRLPQSPGISVAGVDVSERMVALARQRHPDVVFYHEDICRWKLPR